MGCIIVKALDPSPPNNAIVDFWHINGVLLDYNDNGQRVQVDQFVICPNHRCPIQQYSAGVLYVFNSRLVYRPRHCTFSRNSKLLQFEICDIQEINSFNKFTSRKVSFLSNYPIHTIHAQDGKTFSRSVVDITISPSVVNPSNIMHVGFVSKEADKVAL